MTKSLMAILLLVFFVAWTPPQGQVQKLSLVMDARVLYLGKSTKTTGQVFYSVKDGALITKINTPFQQYVKSTALGEYTSYEFKTNQVTLSQGANFSSQNSFFYNFLSGQISDMGLAKMGYKMFKSDVEEGMLVTTWKAKENMANLAANIKVVYENNLPVFLGFFDAAMKPKQKTYYTNYKQVSYMKLPLTVTEIEYTAEGDSIISQRKYSDLKINGAVDNTWFDFMIPSDAKVVSNSK